MHPAPSLSALSALSVRALLCLLLPLAITAQQPSGSPRREQPGPWDQDVLVYRLGTGRPEQLAIFGRAGVPTLARLADGRLIAAFQHFPADDDRNFDRVAVCLSKDEGRTWTKPEPIAVDNMEAGLARPFDPTLVPLPDGRVRLYFTSNRSPDFRRSVPAIYSAISRDGLCYEFEPGVRFALEGRVVIDCAAALHDGVFHLIVPDNGTPEEMRANEQRREPPSGGSGYHAISKDGLNFERVADVTMPGQGRWLGNMQSDGGRLAFFGTGPGPWPVTSADGVTWQADGDAVRVPGADPGAVKLKDGSWLAAVTGPPREGTASARSRRQPAPGASVPPGNSGGPRPFAPKSTAEALNQMWSRGQATGKGPVRLQNLSLRLEDIERIIPMGLTASGHVTPSDHLYIVPKSSPGQPRRTDVVAVADGFLVVVQWRPKGNPDPTVFDREVDLKLTLEHSATCWSYYDHVTELEVSLLKAVGEPLRPGPPFNVRIPVKAGQVIGHVERMFDFALVDTTVTRPGFARLEQFLHRDPWKPHTVDPFDYVDEPLRGKLLALNPRKVKPLGGQIGYDVPGRLIGNWYRQESGGYAGLNRRLDYWDGHVAFVYHHVEPEHIVVSLGNYEGKPRQFWVKGNAPDPAKVSAADGLVKYELLWGQLGSSGQRTVRHDADAVQGVVLAQLQADGRLKLEIFPGRAGAEVKGFTETARIYER
ncbi:MAG: Uncharacterized protein FD140_2734 [Limisphaerales bacterium]|nr:MAG: Uncharacterized protein FD140_2734 [Limisphaerales bacterium]